MKHSATQYVYDEHGKKISVILPVKEYEQILDKLEELEDVRDYDAAQLKNEKGITLDEYITRRKNRAHG